MPKPVKTAVGPTSIDQLIIRGARVQADLADRVLSCKISLSAPLTADDYAVSQMTLTLADPDRATWNTHLLDLGASLRLGALYCQVAETDLQDGPDGPQVVATARSWGSEKLRNDRGARNWASMTIERLAAQLAEPYGLGVVVPQPGPPLGPVWRNGPITTIPGDRGESSAQMLQRLCKERGLVMMEAYGVLYIGTPTDLAAALPGVRFDAKRMPDDVLAITSARRTTDEYGRDTRAITLSVTQELAARLAPGQLLYLTGLERFSRDFLISRVEYDVATDNPATVTGVVALDPPVVATGGASDTSASTTTAADPTFAKFVNAIVGQESGGDYNAVSSAGAIGRYQVMPANIAAWSRSTLGRTVSVEEFRRTPAIQDNVAIGILWQLYAKSGPRGAAAAWYSGRPELQNDYGVRVHSNPTVGAYCDSVMARMKESDNTLPADYTGPGSGVSTTSGATGAGGKTGRAFADLAQKQVDGPAVYRLGAEASVSDASPDAFDCSELVQWCAGRLGVTVPDGSSAQAAFVQRCSVASAGTIRGALLFHPGHVAISMGDGVHTVEAASTRTGLVNGSIGARFSSAGLIPGLTYDLHDPGLRTPGRS